MFQLLENRECGDKRRDPMLEAVVRRSLSKEETFDLKRKSLPEPCRRTADAKALRQEGGFREQKGGQGS